MLNGSEGVNEVVAGVVGQGLAIYDTLRKNVVSSSPPVDGEVAANGQAPHAPAAVASTHTD